MKKIDSILIEIQIFEKDFEIRLLFTIFNHNGKTGLAVTMGETISVDLCNFFPKQTLKLCKS